MAAITNTVLATINHISLPTNLGKEDVNAFATDASVWCTLPVQVHVFDFKHLQTLHRSIYPAAAKFRQNVESRQSRLISINLNPIILAQLKADGMEQAFGYMKDLNLNNKSQKKDTLEETRALLVKYAVEAGRSAMNLMFNTTVAADENYREPPGDIKADKFFKVAIIRGDATRFKAIFRLFFEKETLHALTKTVADMSGTPVDQELLLSTATELLNIIYTSVKSKVNDERDYGLPPAIPALVDPAQVFLDKGAMARGSSWVPFVTPLGAYYLQIELGA